MKALITVLVVLFVALLGASAPGARENGLQSKDETLIVLRIGDAYEVLPKSGEQERRKQVLGEHKKVVAAWRAARKKAGDRKEPRPVPPEITIIGNFKNQKLATAAIEKDKLKVSKLDGTFAVIQRAEALLVVKQPDVAETKKAVEVAYAEALKAWRKKKREARKSKTAFEDPKPERPEFKVVKDAFDTKAAAEAYLEKFKKLRKKAG